MEPVPRGSSIFTRGAVGGIACLFGACCGMMVAIAILVRSDGQPVASWKYSPTVYLSISYTISNILLNAALAQGVTITWWRVAARQGTTLGDLHRYWDFGNNAISALTAGRHFNFIAFATLFVTLTAINGPLLQRSSTIITDTRSSTVDLTIPAATTIDYFTGIMFGRSHVVSLITDEFAPVVQAYHNGAPVTVNNTNCASDGICSGRLRAAGLSVRCDTTSAPFTLELSNTGGGSTTDDPAYNGTDVFRSQFGDLGYYNADNLSLAIQFKDQAPCTGDMVVKNCSLKAATVEYPVIVDGNRSTIELDPKSTVYDDTLIDDADYAPDLDGSGGTKLGGYAFALQNRFNAESHIRFGGAVGYELTSTGPTGPQFAIIKDISGFSTGLCSLRFTDPTDTLLQQARQLMFRTALAGGNSSNIQYIPQAQQTEKISVYQSHYLFLGLAVAVTLVAVFIVLATFRGHLHLRRDVTLSPVEVARAFDAPLLISEPPNPKGGVSELVKRVGKKPVHYSTGIETGFDRGGLQRRADEESQESLVAYPLEKVQTRPQTRTSPVAVAEPFV